MARGQLRLPPGAFSGTLRRGFGNPEPHRAPPTPPVSPPCPRALAVPAPSSLSQRERNSAMARGARRRHHHGPSASWSCPGALLAPRGGTQGSVPSLARDPGRRRPPPPPAAGSFPSEQMGQGSGGRRRRRRAEKAIFSRYIFYKSNILCISALPVIKASRAQPRDSAAEPVSQQRLAATWLLAGGRAGRRGPHAQGQFWGSP